MGEDSIDHLLLHCPVAFSASSFIFKEFVISICFPKKADEWMLEILEGLRLKGKVKVLWCCAVKAALWST